MNVLVKIFKNVKVLHAMWPHNILDFPHIIQIYCTDAYDKYSGFQVKEIACMLYSELIVVYLTVLHHTGHYKMVTIVIVD